MTDDFEREAKQLADIIVNQFLHNVIRPRDISEMIAQALEAAYQKGLKESVTDAAVIGFKEGFEAAKSMAAKVAQDHARIKGAHIHKGFAYCVEQVAGDILALQPPEKTGGAE